MRQTNRILLLFVATMFTVSSAERKSVTVDGKMAKDSDSKFKVTDNPSVAQQVVNKFFSVTLDSLISAADGYTAVLDPSLYFFQISSTGIPVDLTVFNSPTVFINPSPDDLVQAENFAALVNHNSVVSNIEDNYWNILRSASTSPNTNPDNSTMQAYLEAINYLFSNGLKRTHKSPVFAQYLTLTLAYGQALVKYRAAQATLNATAWYIQSPIYEAQLINAAGDLQAVAPQVESALDVISTAGASLSSTIFANAISLFKNTAIASVIAGETFSIVNGFPSFHAVFPQPTDWATNDAEYTSVSISSSNFQSTLSSSYQVWATASGGTLGFFSWTGTGNITQRQTYQVDATDLTLNLEYLLVELNRPWLDDSIFGISSWTIAQQAAGSISNGQPNQSSGILPSYTSHILVVKNLTIHASWSARDISYFSTQISTGRGFGFGCFSIGGGSYQNGSSQTTQQAQFQNSVITAPGAQIIGYVQKIVPFSPPNSQ